MRNIYPALAAIVMAATFSYGASAATLLIPPTPSVSSYQTVAGMEMTVATDNSKLREKPNTSSKVLGKLPKGTKVTVIEKVESDTWAHVQVNNMDGYISMKLLQ